jgi:N4-gp56 family major capsid protein
MASTNFTTSSSLTFKQQLSGLFATEERVNNEFVKNGWRGKGANFIFRELPAMKEGGDSTTYPLLMQLEGPPVAGDSPIEGNERALTYYSDIILLDQARFGAKIAGRMAQQFTKQQLREDHISNLSAQSADWELAVSITMLSGKIGTQTALTNKVGVGFAGWAGNTLTDVDSTHLYWGGDATSKATLDALDKITYNDFVRMSTVAYTTVPKIPRLKIGGQYIKGVALMHPDVKRDLQLSMTGALTWAEIEKAKLQGGADFKNSGIVSGAAGILDGWIIQESELCPIYTDYGAGSVRASRVLFLGAGAGTYLTGKFGDGVEWDYVEKKFDADNQLGFYVGKILGVKPAIFNSKRFAMLALDVACAAS